MTDRCRTCKVEIARKHVYCRPCAIGISRNRPAYAAPCATYVPEHIRLVKTCAECGWEHPKN